MDQKVNDELSPVPPAQAMEAPSVPAAFGVTPASLVDQWQSELETKFFERFELPVEPEDWERMPRAIASISRARHKRHESAIICHRWDLVVVDEAHKVKNHKSAAYRLVLQLAAAGGWKETRTLLASYQQPDDKTLQQVVLEAPKLYASGVE